MLGKVCTSTTPYYDTRTHSQRLKGRPVLIIGIPDNGDYNVLPISKISKQHNRDPIYDIEVDPAKYPLLNLTYVSYIRTHKQTAVHYSSINQTMGDLKTDYEDLYLAVLEKLEQYNKELLDAAI